MTWQLALWLLVGGCVGLIAWQLWLIAQGWRE